MTRKLQPSGDHILIQFSKATHAIAGKKVKPPTRSQRSFAKVIAVGPGKESADGTVIPLGLRVGERIVVADGRGIKIRLHRQNYAVIRKHDLIEARG